MDLKSVFERINFVSRYQSICESHNDFDNGLRGNHKEKYDELLSGIGYTFKYFSREKFYKIEHETKEYNISLHLVLKDGIVEPILYIKKGGKLCSPDGRFDFIPEELGANFDRDKYNIPSYVTLDELEEILKDIFSLYEDIKKELLKDGQS